MKLRINTKLRAALIAAITTVGFTLPQSFAATQYTAPAFGGAEYVWTNGHWEYPAGTTVNKIARVDKKGGVMVINDAGTVSNSAGMEDTSDYGGVKVTGNTTFSTGLGSWAGSIYVGAAAVLNASYGTSLKNTEAATAANVYVDGTLNITGRNELNLNDGNNYQNWYIGETGFINLSGITSVNKGSRAWNIQLNVDAGEPMSLDGYTNRTLGGQFTKKFMSTGADLYGQVASFAVFCENNELASTAYTINHDASGMSVTYDVATTIKNMDLTWAGGEDTWEVKGTHWKDGEGTETSFANGDNVTFSGSGNVARVSGAVEANAITVNGGASTIDTTATGASLKADSLTIGAGGSLTLAGTAVIGGAVSVADANALVIGAGSTLKVGSGAVAKALMMGTGVTNNGIFEIAGDVTLDNGVSTKMTGALKVDSGVTLKLSQSKDKPTSIASFGSVILAGGNLWSNTAMQTVNNVSAIENSRISFADYPDNYSGVLTTFAGNTNIENGKTLTIYTEYKSNLKISHLTGAGTLDMTTANRNDYGEFMEIGSLEGFTGNISLAPGNANNPVRVTAALGNADVSMGTLSLNGNSGEASADKHTFFKLTGEHNLTLKGIDGAKGEVSLDVPTLTLDTDSDHSYKGSLAISGALVKTGSGTQTISGYEMHKGIDVKAGTLVLNGEYSIDGIETVGDNHYVDNTGETSTSGFLYSAGTKTVYTVADDAHITITDASFKSNDTTVQLDNGKYAVDPTTDKTTLWVNGTDSVSYDTYYAVSDGALTTAKVAGGATLTVGTNAVGTLAYQTNGTTINLGGTGTVNAISGTGTLNLLEGAVVTVAANQTLGANQAFITSGKGTLKMGNLHVSGNGAAATIGSKAELHQITMGAGTVNLNGDITMDRFVLSLENAASTMNIGKDANVHVTGTTLSVGNNDASFMVSNWNQVNTLNIEGRLIAEAGISARDGKANVNVKNGGTLELHQGLLYKKNTGEYTNINVESGGTLLTAGNTTDQAAQGLRVNLNNGSTLKGYYGTSDTAAIAQPLTLAGTVTFDAGEAGKTLQINSSITGEGASIVKTGDGALVLNGSANVLYNALNVQGGTVALNGTFDASHITHDPGTVEYYKNPEGPATDNGFAKYVGVVQLITGNTSSVSVGDSATITLDGFSVTYDASTGKATSSELSLDTFYINKNSESVSSIVAVAPEAGVSLADGAKLVVDAGLTGAISVRSGRGLVQIDAGQTLKNTSAAIELSGSGTYALAAGSLNKGGATLGQDWDGYLRITNFTPNNAQNLGGLGSALELNGFKGWDSSNWAGTMAMDIRLTDYVEGETTKVAWSCGAFSSGPNMPIGTFTGTWSGTGTFKQDCASGKYMGYEYQGDISAWTGAFITTCNTNLTFSNAATAVNIAISKESGTLDLVVNSAATFTKGVAVDSTAISTSATFKNTASLGTVSGAGAITVDAGEGNTVTINGHSGLANTITLTSGTLSLNGTISISDDMPVDGSITYSDGDNGFRTVEGKLQIVSVAEGAILSEGEGISYIYGGKQIATSLDNGAIALTSTTSYETYYVNQGTASLSHAIQGATEHGTTLTSVVMANGTALTADGGSTGLVLADGASATVETTAATTISSLTGSGEGKTLTLGGTAQLTIQNPNDFAGSVNVQSGANVYLDGTTTTATLAKFANDGTLSVAVGNGTQIAMTNSTGTLKVRSGQVDYRSTLGGQTLELVNATLLFGNKGTDTTHTYAGNIVVSGNATVTTYGTSQHPQAYISGSVTGDGTLTRNNDGNQALYFTGAVDLGGYTNSDAQGGNLTDFQGATKLGTLTITTDAARTKFSHADTVIGTIAMNTNATVEIAGDTSVGVITGNKVLTLNVTNDATATLTGTSSFNKLVSTGKVVVAQGAEVTLDNNLTPNSGTVEVNGTVSANHEVDLSNGGDSTGIVKVGSTGVVSTKDGMWMAKSAAVELAQDGKFNIAGLSIVGEAGGGSVTTTADNGQYGTDNDTFVITNAAVTGTTDINLGNKLVNSTLTTGAYTMTLNNAASTYDAVYVSEGGSLVVNADVNLAGVLQSSGAITVNADKTLTLGTGSSLFQTVTNSGTVSLTGVTLGAGFQEETDGSAYYGLDGVTPVEVTENHYEGTATTYVQVVNGGTSTGTGLVWNQKTYDLSGNTGRIIVGQGGADYGTFYVTTQINSSDLIQSDHYGQLNTIVVTNWAELTLDEAVTGKTIEVQDGGFITGSQVTPESVAMAAGAVAVYNDDVTTESGVTFSSAIVTTITNTNEDGDPVQYSTSEKALAVSADTMTMSAETDVTVSNQLVVDEIVNETGHKLTLDNAETLELKSMLIGEGSTVEMLYTDQEVQKEGTVTITETLEAGGGTLLANLTIADADLEDGVNPLLNVNGGDDNALTLGSQFTIAEGTLVTLDADTIAALEGMQIGESLDIIRALDETSLTYGEDGQAMYDGMWFGQLFERVTGVEGDYLVVADGTSFGLKKVSNTPEPTTGTLSLLALAALAARRRRK